MLWSTSMKINKGLPIEYELLLNNDFYKIGNYNDRNEIKIGQLCLAHIIHPLPNQCVLTEVEKKLTFDDCLWKVEKYENKKFSNGEYYREPFSEYNIESDEVLYVYKGKRRPCVILSITNSLWFNKFKSQKVYLVLPLYTTKKRHPSDWIVDIQAFNIDYAFYFPHSSGGLNEESIGLFYNIQTIQEFEDSKIYPLESITNQNKPIFLSDEILKILIIHLYKYLSLNITNFENEISIIEENLKIFSQLIMDEYKKNN